MSVESWIAALEARHLRDLTFAETTRALRALSSGYVERRERLSRRSALDSAGKRAAYALFYSPLHFLTVDRVLAALHPAAPAVESGAAISPTVTPDIAAQKPGRLARVLDLGCGAGAAGAAWALRAGAAVSGVDAHPWAVSEALFTYRHFALDGEARRGDLTRVRIDRQVDGIALGWAVNELSEEGRAALLPQVMDAARRGVRVLIVEPIATRVSPWWPAWAGAFEAIGGRADEWRFRVELPDLLRRLDRAAGLRHEELTARSIWI